MLLIIGLPEWNPVRPARVEGLQPPARAGFDKRSPSGALHESKATWAFHPAGKYTKTKAFVATMRHGIKTPDTRQCSPD